jgi:hypothetical protein
MPLPSTLQEASSFNQPLSFDTSKVTSMREMFQVRPCACRGPHALSRTFPVHPCLRRHLSTPFGLPARTSPRIACPSLSTRQRAYVFNQPLSFDTSKVWDMGGMFDVRSVRVEADVSFLRLVTTRTRSPNEGMLQLAQLVAYGADGEFQLQLVDARNPHGRNPGAEGPDNALDGSAHTKWLDYNKGALECRIASGPTKITRYALVTANDAPNRDPVRWVLEGRLGEDGEWRVLDDKDMGEDQPVPSVRHAMLEVTVTVLEVTAMVNGAGAAKQVDPLPPACHLCAPCNCPSAPAPGLLSLAPWHALLSTRQAAYAFNQPLSFDTSKVMNMRSMFHVRFARALPPKP